MVQLQLVVLVQQITIGVPVVIVANSSTRKMPLLGPLDKLFCTDVYLPQAPKGAHLVIK